MHAPDSDFANLSLHERVRGWLQHLEHVLPAQAPIRNFVHHNTLHGLQHLPFAEALAEATRTTGAWPWMAENECRRLHAAGRITDGDLDAAFAELGFADLDAPVAGFPALRRRDVLRTALRHDLRPPGAARRQWLLDESRVDAALLAACAVLDEVAPPVAADGALKALFSDIFPEAPAKASWHSEARSLWPELVARVGRDWTLSTLLFRLTGENVFDAVRPILVRHVAAHLDQGMAAWHNPLRSRGFYAAWRQSAGRDMGWELDELIAARDEIAALPEDPVDTIGRELMHLGPSEAHWGDYLERLSLELPGWSGMFLWRDRHPDVAVEGNAVPVAMADYLAVRLVLERLHCEDLVRRTWGLPLFLSELGDHFLGHPAELWVRHAFFAGELPEAAASDAQRLIVSEISHADADWIQLADSATGDAAATDKQNACWSLYLLAEALALSPQQIRAATLPDLHALLALPIQLKPHQRGHLWLLAYERNYRERIFSVLAANHGRSRPNAQPAAQLVFCMDDREEGTRRHLEEINPALETFGAAGFFGVPMYWRGLDDEAPTALCPVVVTPANEVRECAGDAELLGRHRQRRALRLAWKERLHRATRDSLTGGPLMAALGAPLAVGALALQTLAPACFGDLVQRWRQAFDRRVATHVAITAAAEDAMSLPRQGFTEAEQIERVAGFLRSIGLTENFAPLVVIVGHGSNSVNNPHLAAYDCGACSGRHGGPNARVFAAMANRPDVRAGVAARGIAIPDGTWFLGAEHNTGDESIQWYDLDDLPKTHQTDFDLLLRVLGEATRRHAVERCRRFASAPFSDVPPTAEKAKHHLRARRHDWSQARPELGHATVAVAFIGRRSMSRGAFFDRRSFLISYNPLTDEGGRILEATLLAAGPVGAGIALEYYFSTVDNERLGCGTKIMHNLASLLGVMEGASSDLRTGLPRQMIEIHEPMRLLVVIEQTREVVGAIYERQPPLRELIGNGWIMVAVKEPLTGDIHRFDPVRGWLPWQGGDEVPVAASSAEWLGTHREPLPPALLSPLPPPTMLDVPA